MKECNVSLLRGKEEGRGWKRMGGVEEEEEEGEVVEREGGREKEE